MKYGESFFDIFYLLTAIITGILIFTFYNAVTKDPVTVNQ